jgi:uncharacterized protein (TIGR03435 family)
MALAVWIIPSTLTRHLLVVALAAAGSLAIAAQGRTAFEVTSVHLNTSGERRASIRMQPNGDFMAVNQPLRVLLTFAYETPLYLVEGMPEWFTSERYDVTAKAPAGLNMEPFGEVRGRLLRSLLEDRFTLKARFVTKEMLTLMLGFSRDDHRLGPRLKMSTVDCDGALAAARERAVGSTPAQVAASEPVCNLGGLSASPICGRAVTMERLVQGLAGVFQEPVVNETKLDGRFDFDLSFTPDNARGPGVAFGANCPQQSDDRPALMTALQEQLGLRLRQGRAPIEVLVVDSAQRPTEN